MEKNGNGKILNKKKMVKNLFWVKAYIINTSEKHQDLRSGVEKKKLIIKNCWNCYPNMFQCCPAGCGTGIEATNFPAITASSNILP